MTRTITETMTVRFRRVVVETSDERPSLRPAPAARVVTTEAEEVSKETRHAFEYIARQKKIARLTAHITELVSLLDLTPVTDGWMIAELVGVETRLAVIDVFARAARKAS